MRITMKWILPGIFIFIGLDACKKDGQPAPSPITISAISPASGPYSTVDTIRGSGFNETATADIVKYNDVDAVVQEASDTELIVVVPKAAGTGLVTVQAGSLSGTGPVFNYTATGTVTTLAGNSVMGFVNGTGTNAEFNFLGGLATDVQGNIYACDILNNCIRKITAFGVVTTFAGNGIQGYVDGTASSAEFNQPAGIVVDAQGNVFVADQGNERIRKITPSGVVSTIAGSGTAGFVDGSGIAAQFNAPLGLAIDANGNIYVADSNNGSIRKISPTGVVSTLAGDGIAGYTDDNGASAKFYVPIALVLDTVGNVYVSDQQNAVVRKITPAGDVTTFAGSKFGFANGIGNMAEFYSPYGIAIDAKGNVFLADAIDNTIREISPTTFVSTVAGSPGGFQGTTDGIGGAALFNGPGSIAIDMQGNMYVADVENNTIRKITIQ